VWYRDRFFPALLSTLVLSTVNPLNFAARGDIRSEKTVANPVPGKGEIDRRNNFENL
jgi:hypothetical protein